MDHVLQFFQQLDNLVWGAPLLVLLVGTGIYLTLRLGLLQIRYLPKAFRLIFTEDEGHGDISSFGALATALAATVGTGNIVGVATAIQTGGPGALFWMWMAAFFGMATKYAEGLLAIRYRPRMTTVISQVVRCTTFFTGWERSGDHWLFSLRLQECWWPSLGSEP